MPRFFIVDAFTPRAFGGNQAGVCVLDAPGDERWMQAVASELGFAETAFTWREAGQRRLRWFTPVREVPLCGHATLATAHVLWSEGIESVDVLSFATLSGVLSARRVATGVELDFPSSPVSESSPLPGLERALGARIVSFHETNGEFLLVELEDEGAVRELRPDLAWLATLDPLSVIVTARGDGVDYVHRFFAPSWGIPEDPATGSIQTALGPFWAARLGKSSLEARQLSPRGASMTVSPRGARTLIAGSAVTVARGELVVTS